MNKNEKMVFIFILSVLTLGLIFITLNKYRFYQDFIINKVPIEGIEYSDITESSDATDNIVLTDTEIKKINLNEAGLESLVSIPGIGKQTALKIIDYRTRFGNYKSVEELLNIKGIGYKKLENIRDYVTIK